MAFNNLFLPKISKTDGLIFSCLYTINDGSRRAEKSRKVLMMMKAAKLGLAGAGAGKKQGWTMSCARKGRSRAEVGTGQEYRLGAGRQQQSRSRGRCRSREGGGQR